MLGRASFLFVAPCFDNVEQLLVGRISRASDSCTNSRTFINRCARMFSSIADFDTSAHKGCPHVKEYPAFFVSPHVEGVGLGERWERYS